MQPSGKQRGCTYGEGLAYLNGTVDPVAGYNSLIEVDEECEPAKQGEQPLRSVPARLTCCHACQWLHLWIHLGDPSRAELGVKGFTLSKVISVEDSHGFFRSFNMSKEYQKLEALAGRVTVARPSTAQDSHNHYMIIFLTFLDVVMSSKVRVQVPG